MPKKQRLDSAQNLPAHVEAERAVLGAVFLDNSAYYEIVDQITVDDFSLDSHHRMYLAMHDLIENGIPIDFITITEVLRRRGEMEAIGGDSYLCSITDGLPKRQNLKNHCDILREKGLLRQLIHAGNSFVAQAYAQTDETKDIIASAEETILQISEQRISKGLADIGTIVKEDFGSIDELFQRGERVTGIASGFDDFDSMTNGFHAGELIVIAARPGMGKTAFCVNIAENCSIRNDKLAAIFSMEMTRGSLVQRMLCSQARVDSHKLRTGFLARADYAKLTEATARLVEAPIYIDDQSALTVPEMRAKCKRLKQRHGRLDLVIADYLQLMSGGKKFENRTQEVSAIARGLKNLSKDLGCPVVALSQLNRLVEARGDKRPVLSDLREAGEIEAASDLVGFIFRGEVYEPNNPDYFGLAELIVSKQRNGPTGTVHLCFLKQFTRFENRLMESGATAGY